MILADTMAIFFVVVGLLLAFNGIWLMSRAVWSGFVDESVAVFQKDMWKSFLLGLPALVIVMIVVGALSSMGKGPPELINLIVMSVFFLYSSIGVAGLATVIGERLGHAGKSRYKSTLYGGIVLSLSYLFPLAGWLVVMPLTTIIGCGAATRAIWRCLRRPAGTTSATGNLQQPQEESAGIRNILPDADPDGVPEPNKSLSSES